MASHPDSQRISAVITTYNAAHFVADAIESVLAQTRLPDEIVVIDDGSTDHTAQVVARYAAQGVRYVYQENRGPSAARNRGVRETTGELIAFLDADDIWLSEKLALQLAALEAAPEAVLVGGNRWRWLVEQDTREYQYFGPPAGTDARYEILVRNIVGNPSQVLVRRSALDLVGLFDTDMRWAEDWELWVRIMVRMPAVFINQPIAIYRWHPNGLAHEHAAQRFRQQLGVAFRTIGTIRPIWRCLILLARRVSWDHFDQSRSGDMAGLTRARQIQHALLSLLIFPFEETLSKVKRVFRAVVGSGHYAGLKTNPHLAALRRRHEGVTQGGD